MTSATARSAGDGHPAEPVGNAQRTLGRAEGILVASGWCSLEKAFTEIVDTAKRHNVSVIQLADALIAIIDDTVLRHPRDEVMAAASQTWGTLADRLRQRAAPAQVTATTQRAANTAPHRARSSNGVIDAIPLGDDVDLAEQSEGIMRSGPPGVGDVGDVLVGNREADPADLIEQRMPVADVDDQPSADDRD